MSEVDGELEQAIETTADLVPCPECGAVAQLHDRRPCWVRDLPVGGRPVMLVWVKRVWRCPHRWCSMRTWTETSPVIAPRASLTGRARAEICRRVGEDAAAVAVVAREFGIGWRTAMAAVREHGTPRVDDPTRLAATSWETARTSRPWPRHGWPCSSCNPGLSSSLRKGTASVLRPLAVKDPWRQ